jgi:hypothetical protein
VFEGLIFIYFSCSIVSILYRSMDKKSPVSFIVWLSFLFSFLPSVYSSFGCLLEWGWTILLWAMPWHFRSNYFLGILVLPVTFPLPDYCNNFSSNSLNKFLIPATFFKDFVSIYRYIPSWFSISMSKKCHIHCFSYSNSHVHSSE